MSSVLNRAHSFSSIKKTSAVAAERSLGFSNPATQEIKARGKAKIKSLWRKVFHCDLFLLCYNKKQVERQAEYDQDLIVWIEYAEKCKRLLADLGVFWKARLGIDI